MSSTAHTCAAIDAPQNTESRRRAFGRRPRHARRAAYAARAPLHALLQALRPLDPGIELIRIGPDSDGGYLVPDDLDGIRHAFSPGVSTESGFEAELAGPRHAGVPRRSLRRRPRRRPIRASCSTNASSAA